ncbi:hypothetical protein [Sinanaerobacter sp. ZZT-01]|uniref:hypothetical protein n=1 Tax=Sinanaerobacter sp. ZZT-01 TaxID=3111540 RepID=UPI002D78223C|nr:hypothetical protein [Sinanaerobacter sp. ZZT-01]WRR93832.1 hypothetical protein U5921_01535 [Sinanaerobacter sp. ZZT-01]
MFTLDHIMIETDYPQKLAKEFSEIFELPYAWPYSESKDYSSVGINFGQINIEFIKFKLRFGKKASSFNGLSGVAFIPLQPLEKTFNLFDEKKLSYRIGEDIEAHTTVTVNEEQLFPTIFLVKYRFDTTGWKKRLKEEFKYSNGGAYRIKNLHKLVLPGKPNKKVEELFPIVCYKEGITKAEIIFNSELSNSNKKLVTLNNSSLNFEIYIK